VPWSTFKRWKNEAFVDKVYVPAHKDKSVITYRQAMGGASFQCTSNVHFAFNEYVAGQTSCEKKRQGGEKGTAKLYVRYNVNLYLKTYHFGNRQREWPSQNNGIISAKKKKAPMKK
jgi:hypothetical protein